MNANTGNSNNTNNLSNNINVKKDPRMKGI